MPLIIAVIPCHALCPSGPRDPGAGTVCRAQPAPPARGSPTKPWAVGSGTGRHVLCCFLVPAGHLSSGRGAAQGLTSVGVVAAVLLLGLLSDLRWLLDTLEYKLTPRGRSGSNPLGIFLEPNSQTLSRYVSQVPTVRTHSALEAKGPGRSRKTLGGRRGCVASGQRAEMGHLLLLRLMELGHGSRGSRTAGFKSSLTGILRTVSQKKTRTLRQALNLKRMPPAGPKVVLSK